MSVKTKCPKCGRSCIMGVNATVDGCDECTGVRRDFRGWAWEPGEMEQTIGSTGEIVKRPEGI